MPKDLQYLLHYYGFSHLTTSPSPRYAEMTRVGNKNILISSIGAFGGITLLSSIRQLLIDLEHRSRYFGKKQET